MRDARASDQWVLAIMQAIMPQTWFEIDFVHHILSFEQNNLITLFATNIIIYFYANINVYVMTFLNINTRGCATVPHVPILPGQTGLPPYFKAIFIIICPPFISETIHRTFCNTNAIPRPF